MMNTQNVKLKEMGSFRLTPSDKWILSKLNNTVKESTKCMEKYDLGLACSSIYDFVWNDFCDWYIELSKAALYGDNADKKANTVTVLNYVLDKILKLLHPFVPFITDEIYSFTATAKSSIMISDWPQVIKKYNYKKERETFEKVMDIIKGIRNLRVEMNVKPSQKIDLIIAPSVDIKVLDTIMPYIIKMANIGSVSYIKDKQEISEKVSVIISDFGDILIPLGNLVDNEKEIARLTKDLEDTNSEIERATKMLNNQGFIARAPKQLVDKEKEKLANYTQLAEKIKSQIEELKNA